MCVFELSSESEKPSELLSFEIELRKSLPAIRSSRIKNADIYFINRKGKKSVQYCVSHSIIDQFNINVLWFEDETTLLHIFGIYNGYSIKTERKLQNLENSQLDIFEKKVKYILDRDATLIQRHLESNNLEKVRNYFSTFSYSL